MNPPQGRVATRLIGRLKRLGLLEADGAYLLERTFAGSEMKSHGAWSWYLTNADGVEVNVGSQFTATDCLAMSDAGLPDAVS